MFTQTATQLVQWQDLKVRSEVDIVLDLANQKGWKDCEIFGSGDMITQPLDSNGWTLIPADLYEYSIPAQGADRVLQAINAGVRIKGVIIADDQRRTEPTPSRFKVFLQSAGAVLSSMGKVLLGWLGKAMLGLLLVAGVIAIGCLIFLAITKLGLAILGIAFLGMLFSGTATDYDPKLIILVDDGNGGTEWISLFTWYD
jgi:hypothetical protein